MREVAAVEGKIMKYTIHIPKPLKKMKTVAKQLEECLYYNNCSCCWHKGDKLCQIKLMSEGLYYIRQTIEKSEGGNGGKKKTGTDAAGVI